MYEVPFQTDIETTFADSVVSAARTSLGDTLRSVVYFTPGAMDVLYVRQDLYESRQRAVEAKARLVEFERVGFAEAPVRTALSPPTAEDGIGAYDFTVRVHGEGFVVRVLADDDGVLLTTDDMDVEAFEEAAVAIRRFLNEP
ncbi:DUF7522 family protein [Haloarcula salinisoli]|uniref:Uncharacterized protein n=1 Tax=Haloarcula salinisoli TaxID=2487746 RepID=A0A8J8C751_9EURY|nr:hypothetical protein [Halomicroarcula salinisoli]MBX0285536.1 hypothetical protein [Halomicroarcula salinisoli]MBX0302981.1 hypothetical protein [Halomicroarcula salinisoli]